MDYFIKVVENYHKYMSKIFIGLDCWKVWLCASVQIYILHIMYNKNQSQSSPDKCTAQPAQVLLAQPHGNQRAVY